MKTWLQRAGRHPVAVAAGLVSLPLTVLSLPGVPADVAGWGAWLAWVDDGLARWMLPVAGWVVLTGAVIYSLRLAGRTPDLNSEPQAGDGPLERELADDIRKGERLRDRYRSADPPRPDKAGKWTVDVIERLQAHDEEGYVDRLHGSAADQVHPPHDAQAQADYMDGRLDELRRILASVRGELVPSEERVGKPTVRLPRPDAPSATTRHLHVERDEKAEPASPLVQTLQQHRSEGLRLLRALRDPLVVSATLYRRRFHGEDVASWIEDVRHTLREHKSDLALFDYEGPPVEFFVTAMATLGGEHVRRMERRLRQLDKVIERHRQPAQVTAGAS